MTTSSPVCLTPTANTKSCSRGSAGAKVGSVVGFPLLQARLVQRKMLFFKPDSVVQHGPNRHQQFARHRHQSGVFVLATAESFKPFLHRRRSPAREMGSLHDDPEQPGSTHGRGDSTVTRA